MAKKSQAEKRFSSEVTKTVIAGGLGAAFAYTAVKHACNASEAYKEVKIERKVNELEQK